jgi:hypothetical protein
MNSGNLNFLEPSGPLQASNGTSLYLLRQINDIPRRLIRGNEKVVLVNIPKDGDSKYREV